MTTTAIQDAGTERIERAYSLDLCLAAPVAIREALGLLTTRVGASIAVGATGIDSLLFNRAFAADAGDIDAIVSWYRDRGIARYFIHPHGDLDEAAAERAMRRHGIERYHRPWAKLVRSLDIPPPIVACELPIGRARPGEAAACGQLLAAAFDAPAAAPVFSAVIGRPRWHVYVARDAGAPVAVACLYADGELAALASAATLPAYRRRGAQTALIAHRLRVARELGCRAIASETGVAVPGEPNPSYDNMVRSGFRVARIRPNYAPAGTTWSRAA